MASTPLSGAASASEQVLPYRIRAIDPDHKEDTAAAAKLHACLFGEIGPVAGLGELVLQRYCYGHVLRSGLMKAVLFEVDGQAAGLAAWTGDSVALHRATMGRHFPFAARETIRALIAQPRLLARLPAAVRLLWERRREKLPPTTGRFAEVVAFGVLPPFRSRRFVRRTGLRVPDLLLDYLLDAARAQGFARGRGVVLVSNKPAVAFFSRRASWIESYPAALKPSIQVWFNLARNDPQPAS
jgi:hypothetical protein